MEKLFLVQVRIDEETNAFLMVGEDLDNIEVRVRENNKDNNIEWIDMVEIIEVDQYKIHLIIDLYNPYFAEGIPINFKK